MANAKEIRTKIKSIQSTQKITRAMEMVAASKMRKAQDRMKASRPYSEKMKSVISHISEGRLEYIHPYTIEREVKRVGFIVISTDRGLCGGLNINLFKNVIKEISILNNNKIDIDISVIGKKALTFFTRLTNCNIVASITQLSNNPSVFEFIGVIKIMLSAYIDKKIDRLYIAYNKFINTMTQKPIISLLIPILNNKVENNIYWDYLYEPSAQPLLNALLDRYVESLLYQSVVENIASEQAARMVAMKSASDNAGDIIEEFKLMYNKARQSAITQELSEIVAGAAAV